MKKWSKNDALGVTSEEEILAKYIAGSTAKLLSREQERELAARIKQGDKAAAEQFVMANLRLVISIAYKYQGRGLSLMELIQEGNIGLMEGVKRFDGERENRFSTYGSWWIRAAIGNAIRQTGRTVYLPGQILTAVNKYRKEVRRQVVELQREPTDEEVAEAINTSVEKLTALKLSSVSTVSLDAPAGNSEGDNRTLQDVIADPAEGQDALFDQAKLPGLLGKALLKLTVREREVLVLRFGLNGEDPLTLEEVGALPQFDVSRERIRQIEAKALKKLADSKLADALYEHLD